MSTSDIERTPLLSYVEQLQASPYEQTDAYEHVIMVFGKTGSGVSSTVNTLLGKNACPVGSGMHSTTQEIQSETRSGEKILVIDMPDLVSMDNQYKPLEKSRDVLSRWRRVPPDDTFLVIRSDERYTEEQYNIYREMREKLGDLISPENLMIVFTHGKCFQEEVVRHASGVLQSVLQDAGHRYDVLDNSDSDDDKEKVAYRLLKKVCKCRNLSAPERTQGLIPERKPNGKCSSSDRLLVIVCFVLFIGAIILILGGFHIIILPS